MKVNVTNYGLRPFRITKVVKKQFGTINHDCTIIQYKGEYKLPKNLSLTNGEKWVKLDYWFELDEIQH